MSETEYFKEIISMLKKANVHMFSAEFQGCGDSGEVTAILFHRDGKLIRTGLDAEYTILFPSHIGEYGKKVNFEKSTLSLESHMDTFVDYMSHRDDVDWWNNEGGEGHIMLNIAEDDFNFDIRQFTTETPVCEMGTLDEWINGEL